MEIRYAYQEQDKMLPNGMSVPAERGAKPWGTGHAVLCAADAVDGAPFAVINADDYYGKSAFKTIFDVLCAAEDGKTYNYCMVGYYLKNTVSDHGSVARGVCETRDGKLSAINERLRIEKYENGIHFTEDGENWIPLSPATVVSMTMWGFTPDVFDHVKAGFVDFLGTISSNPQKAEFYLPFAICDLMNKGICSVKAYRSEDSWYGVTYHEDRESVKKSIEALKKNGSYPEKLS